MPASLCAAHLRDRQRDDRPDRQSTCRASHHHLPGRSLAGCLHDRHRCQLTTRARSLLAISYTFEARYGQNFQKAIILTTKEAGTKTKTRFWPETPPRGLNPAISVAVDEAIGDKERLPARSSQPASPVQLIAYALIEWQVRTLQIIVELHHVKQSVTCPSEKNRMRSPRNDRTYLRYKDDALAWHWRAPKNCETFRKGFQAKGNYGVRQASRNLK